ncbi:hypothetical protein GCM10023238_27640 [Streptomyces heliomycini]
MRSAQTQIERVDAIASDVQEVTSNASALSTTVAITFGRPPGEGRRLRLRRAPGRQRPQGRRPDREAERDVIVAAPSTGARRDKRTRGKRD